MTKSTGPRTEPWGTPQRQVCEEEKSLLHLTRKQLVMLLESLQQNTASQRHRSNTSRTKVETTEADVSADIERWW